MSLYVVTGVGPNELEIPLVVFPTQEEAETFVAQFPKHPRYPKVLDDAFVERMGEYVDQTSYELTELGKRLYGALFKDGNYYCGCGGCYSLTILAVEYGQPMVAWDLD